jgi:death on curing protein
MFGITTYWTRALSKPEDVEVRVSGPAGEAEGVTIGRHAFFGDDHTLRSMRAFKRSLEQYREVYRALSQ